MPRAVIAPTAPKKRSLMPSGKLRKALRGHGHALSPIVQIGKAGVTEGLVKQLQHALGDHELVKVKVMAESPDDRFEAAEKLAAEPGVNVVQIVGRALLLYKRHPRTPRYEGKRAKEEAAAEGEAAVAKPARKRHAAASGKKRRRSARPTT